MGLSFLTELADQSGKCCIEASSVMFGCASCFVHNVELGSGGRAR